MSLKMLLRSASSPSRNRRSDRTKGVWGAKSERGSYASAQTTVRLSFGEPGTITCVQTKPQRHSDSPTPTLGAHLRPWWHAFLLVAALASFGALQSTMLTLDPVRLPDGSAYCTRA